MAQVRHSETVNAVVVGFAGPPMRPRHLTVRLPDGRVALSQRLNAPLASQVAPRLVVAATGRRARTRSGDAYTAVETDIVVEVQAGTARHAVVTVTRLR